MEKITEIAKLLGEENEKRLKDSITDIISFTFIGPDGFL